ncbi:hypothetical protein FRC11_014064 [Ceratobasidium sp. 423]|nr:hypothetical protein FRC11_014064 [Ceratobasidium sp. 423]
MSAPATREQGPLMMRRWNWFYADAFGLLRGKHLSVLGALRIGERAIRNSSHDQLGMLNADARKILILGEYPTLIGEIGVLLDMNGKKSCGLNGDRKSVSDYTDQTRALDCSLNSADGNNVINCKIWTYAPDNSRGWATAGTWNTWHFGVKATRIWLGLARVPNRELVR